MTIIYLYPYIIQMYSIYVFVENIKYKFENI